MDTRKRRRTEEPPLDERAQEHVRDDLAEDLPDEELDLDRRNGDEDDDDEDSGRPVAVGH